MKKNKIQSLIIITLCYIFSFGSSVFFALKLNTLQINPVLNILLSDIVATIIIYIFSLIFRNASVYDPYWSIQPIFVVFMLMQLYSIKFQLAHLLILVPFAFWAIRLTINWAVGFENLNWVDWRYTNLKEKSGAAYFIVSFFGIMLLPTVLVFLATVPIVFTLDNANLLHMLLGGAVVLLGVCMQFFADTQMKEFAKESKNKGKCIEYGLWAHSRHPNYFGEICIWWGVSISSISTINWSTFLGAIFITFLFLCISIPMMEAHLVKSRKGYADYASRVKSPLIPFFVRKK